MTIIGITGRATRQRLGRARREDAQHLTPIEARLLMLRPAGPARVVLPDAEPARRALARRRPASRAARGVRAGAGAAFWVVLLAVLGLASYVIDQGGHAVSQRPAASPPLVTGSGRVPVAVAPGDVAVRVSVNATEDPGAWFWCLESTLGLPPEQHLCRNSGASRSANGTFNSADVVHLDAAAVRGAPFYVQMYCRDACRWRASTESAASR